MSNDCGCQRRYTACLGIAENARDARICGGLRQACERSCEFFTRDLTEDTVERLVTTFLGQNVIVPVLGTNLFTSARPDPFLSGQGIGGVGRFPPGLLQTGLERTTGQGPVRLQQGGTRLDLPAL